MLRARVTQLEADYNHLRIESEAPNKDAAQRENHFAKKIYKLENLVNELKKKNTFLEKARTRDDSISLKSAILGKEIKNKKIKGLGGVIKNDEDSGETEALKQRIERLEAEKQVIMIFLNVSKSKSILFQYYKQIMLALHISLCFSKPNKRDLDSAV